MNKVQILAPVSTFSSFFPEEDYFFPKPLIDINGKGMIYNFIDNITKDFNNYDISFVINSSTSREFSIGESIKLYMDKEVQIIEKLNETKGALCSCLLAIDHINKDEELIIANYDQIIDANFLDILNYFHKNNADAGIITFESVHPRWSYIVKDKNDNVLQAVEKKVISKEAIAGFYYFKKASYFFDAAMSVIMNDASTNGLFYISSSLNELILSGKKISSVKIDSSKYDSFYSPEAINKYLET